MSMVTLFSRFFYCLIDYSWISLCFRQRPNRAEKLIQGLVKYFLPNTSHEEARRNLGSQDQGEGMAICNVLAASISDFGIACSSGIGFAKSRPDLPLAGKLSFSWAPASV